MKFCGAGDIRPQTMLKELKSAGAVRQGKDKRLQALQRNYIPQATDEQILRLWGTRARGCRRRLRAQHQSRVAARRPGFERAAKNDRIPSRSGKRSSAISRNAKVRRSWSGWTRGWPSTSCAMAGARWPAQEETPTTRMGVGVYHIQVD